MVFVKIRECSSPCPGILCGVQLCRPDEPDTFDVVLHNLQQLDRCDSGWRLGNLGVRVVGFNR